jgi:hypothetical protein
MSYYDEASWLLIPSGIEEDIVFAQKPTSGLGDLTFTRASDATYTDSTGVIERTPWNLVTFSEMFSDVAWTKTRSTVTANTITAPNGTLTADTWTGDGASGGKYVIQTAAIVSGRSYSVSIYAKKNTNNFIQLFAGTATFGPGAYANFDLNNGAVGTVGAAATATIESVGDGWYRCVVTATSTVTTTGNAHVVSLITSATSPENEINTLTTSVFIWGAQLVEGTDAKPYFATTNRQDVPRLDYRNADGSLSTCPRLLLEPQRTNIFIRSEEFDNANWVKVNASVTANTTTSPDGTINADTITATNTNRILTVQTLTIVSNSAYAISFYVKQNTQRYIYIRLTSNALAANYVSVVFDLQDGTVGETSLGTLSGTFISANVSIAANGFYRISFVGSINKTDGNIGIGFASAKTGNTFDASGTITSAITNGNSLFIFGAQLEAGAYATTFIPTTTAAVTRLADTASKTGVSSLIGQSSGTLFAEFNFGGIVDGRDILNVNSGTTANFTSIFMLGGLLYVRMRANAGALINVTKSAFTAGTHKVAVAYANNDLTMYLDGVLVGQNTSASVAFSAPLSVIRLAETVGGGSSSQLGGGVAQAVLFPTRLTNAQLAQLTTL